LALGGGICVAKDLELGLFMIDTQLGEDEEYRDNMLGNPKRFVKTLKTTLGKLQNRVCVAACLAVRLVRVQHCQAKVLLFKRTGLCSHALGSLQLGSICNDVEAILNLFRWEDPRFAAPLKCRVPHNLCIISPQVPAALS
jgi:hypothetical protein